MKQTKFITLLLLATCLFTACHHNDGPSRDDIKKMKETVQSWMPYLSDNYQEGDSVFFLRTDLTTQETQVEGFVVEASYFFESAYENESDDLTGYLHEDDDSYINLYIEGYTDGVTLKSKESFLGIELWVSYDGETDRINEYCRLMINYALCWEVTHHTIDKDYFTVTSCSDKCTMQYNVGIIKFSNDLYSWELIEKN